MRSGDRDRPFRSGSGQDTSRARRPGPLGLGSASKTGGEGDALRRRLERVDEMIAAARRTGFVVAAENLQNWRDRKGDRRLPASVFRDEPFLLEHLRRRHRPRFVDGARRRLWTGELAPGEDLAMEWTDSVNAPYMTDLFFALGEFTVHSSVVLGAIALQPNQYVLKFRSWETEISDTYDWDHGKSTLIPGVGWVSDDEMIALERAGYGRSYRITSEVARIDDPGVTEDARLP